MLDSIIGGLWNIIGLSVPTLLLAMAIVLDVTVVSCDILYRYDFDSRIVFFRGFCTGWFIEWFIEYLPVYILKLVIQALITYYSFALLSLNGKLVGIVVLIIAMRAGIVVLIIAENSIYT